MNELQTFNFEQNSIRTVTIDDKIYFVAKDVAETLGFKNPRDAIIRHCRGVVKYDVIDSLGRMQETTIIPESDVYRLITNSKLPSAEKFSDWVFEEVLPAIRKHGGYLTEQKIEEALLNPDTLIQLATNLKEEREKRKALEEEKQENKPYVSFAKSVEASVNSVLICDYAKALSDSEGVNVGEKRLYKWLRANKYIMENNMPYQKYVDNGYLEVTSTSVATPSGVRQRFTTKITGKGQIALAQKIVDAFAKDNWSHNFVEA